MKSVKLLWIAGTVILLSAAAFLFIKYEDSFSDGKKSDESKESQEENVGIMTITPETVCMEINSKEQLTASVENASWNIAPMKPGESLGSIDQNGLYTAYNKTGFENVVAKKENLRGIANIVIVPDLTLCAAKSVKIQKTPTPTTTTTTTTTGTTPPPKETSEGTTYVNKWAATFDATLKYEVINDTSVVGEVTYTLSGGFWFIPDYTSGKLKLDKPAGIVDIKVENDVFQCSTTTVNDPFLLITDTDGQVVDTNIVFGKKFITTAHKEGVNTTCLGVSFSDPNSSVIDLLNEYAFPVEIDIADNSSVPLHANFEFSGRKAQINGTLKINKVDF